MSFSQHLSKLKQRADGLAARPRICPDCKSPVPSLPPALILERDGISEVFGKLGACPTCGYAGGGPNACAFDPERGPLGDWPPTIATFGAFTLKQWLTWHKDRSFGRIYDEWLAWLRRQEGVE